MRDLGERQSLVFGQDFQDRLERAVAAGAMQAELIAETALARQAPVWSEQRRQRTDWIAAAVVPHRGEFVGNGADINRPAVSEALNRAGRVISFLRRHRAG